MTDVKQSIVAKALGAFVAIAMVFSFVAPAQAQTTEELQDMINDLLSQIEQLESQIGGGSSSSVCPYTWTSSLSQGDTGMDVMRLQQYLNSNPDHRVAAAGQVGSAGMETEFYGPATAAAVTNFQQMYSSEVLAPVGLANGTGYFGPSTRAKMNSLCDEDMSGDEGEGDGSGSDAELSGIGTLDTFEVDDVSNNDVAEGASDVAVAEMEVEFQDGDARIDFMDIKLAKSGNDPWDSFENISLWIDGDKVAEQDVSDEDDYLGDEDDGIIRVSGLDIVAMADEPVTITLGVSTHNNLAGETGDWDVTVEKMRYFDAAGVATTDSSTDGLGTETATFTTEEAGTDEEITIRTSSNDPDDTTFVVDASDDTNDIEVFKFEVEADEGDIDLNRAVVKVTTSGASTTDVVDDAYLTIGGMTFEAENVSSVSGEDEVTDVTDSKSIQSTGDDVWYSFDIDGDVTVDDGDRMEAVLSVDLKPADGTNYDSGQTIQAQVDGVTGDEWEAEGGDDLEKSDFDGSATGESHLLQTEGVALDFVSSTETFVENDDSTTTDNEGRFTVKVDVTAFETDVWIAKSAATGTGTGATTGMTYLFEDSSGVAVTSDIDAVLTSTSDTETSAGGTTGMFVVREGQTETFTLTVEADPASSGFHRVKVNGVNFESDDGTADSQDALPATDFESEYLNI